MVTTLAGPDVQADLEEQYARAKQLLAEIEAAWEACDPPKPLLTEGGATGSALVAHPLVKMIAEARRDVARLARLVAPSAKARRGAPAKAVVTAGIGKAPSQRLKRVK